MNIPRRKFLKLGTGSLALLAAGCDQLPQELRGFLLTQANESGPFLPPCRESIDPVVHAINRITFGQRPGDYARIRKLAGNPEQAAAAYIEQQLHPEKLDDEEAEYAARRFETLSLPLGELFEYQQNLLHHELMRATLVRAVRSQRQLYEVMVQFWSDHFNIDPSKGDCKWLKVGDDRDVIRKHALGKFPEMLQASALSPAMLWYLDGRVNRRQSGADKPNENYARELLELHTLGVHGGYTQKDVMDVARCLTGWTVRSKGERPFFQIGKVEFNPSQHDFGAKEVLGTRIAAALPGLSREQRQRRGRQELEQVIQLAACHPATARHISTKLCRRFIADEPPIEAVNTVAAAFSQSSGDIGATLRALFNTAQFQQERGNLFKRPFHFVVSALRATSAQTDGGMSIIDFLSRMGQAPFSYPTPDGYPQQAAPWMGTLLWRWNFAVALSRNRIQGTRIHLDTLRSNAGGDTGLMAHLLGRKATAQEARAYDESGAGLALMLASPAFQRC
ncbi:MAG TPA: DUF1800 domain-containing protein [Verrucomicrobiae bacterium]|nr:DUF1800 domain-containing protein [Verrucomicrobiae bacterium]